MGGNALSVSAVRLTADKYFDLWYKIRQGEMYAAFLIKSYREKETFGDMDILIYDTYEENDKNYKRHYLEGVGLEIVEEVKNSSITSFGVQLEGGVFQIDIISLPPHKIPFAYHYFAYNDMGNFIGRVASGIGLKFGHEGLFYVQRNEHRVMKEHLLTENFKEAIAYLGLDVDRHALGFDTMEEVFDFIISSPYYDKNRFDLSQRNYRARVRDRKRENYSKFLEYTKDKPSNTLPDKKTFLEMHFKHFPYLKDAYDAVEREESENIIIKSKFNGVLVQEWTGLTGKELGVLMLQVKSDLSRKEFLQCSEEVIKKYVVATYKEMKNAGRLS